MSNNKVTQKMLMEIIQEALSDSEMDLDEALVTTKGALGDFHLEDYGKVLSEIPTEYITIFQNSGILQSPTIAGRVENLQIFIDNLVEKGNNTYSIEQNIGNIFIVDLFSTLIEYVRGSGKKKINESGGIFEAFIALLFSGTKIGQKGGFADVTIGEGDRRQLISVKFTAPTSSNWQALSTVRKHFDNDNGGDMLFFNLVKSKISSKTTAKNQVKIFLGLFTKQNWLEIKSKMNEDPQEKNWKTDAAFVTALGEEYLIKNPEGFGYTTKKTAAKISPKGPYKAEPIDPTKRPEGFDQDKKPWKTSETEGRITFLDYGDLVATINFPALEGLREKQISHLNKLNTNIVQITQRLKDLQILTVEFSTIPKTEQRKKRHSTQIIRKTFHETKSLLVEELGVKNMEESKKATAEDLKKLFEEKFKK